MDRYTILIVDDEPNIVDIVKAYLEKEQYKVLTATDGKEAIKIFLQNEIHLVILDRMLPEITGEDVLYQIRKESNVPVIMLTAKVTEDNMVEGIRLGADDYVKKPFSVRELVARVSAHIRRTYSKNEVTDTYVFGDIKINFNSFEATKSDKDISLTPNEMKVLQTLVENKGVVLTREQIIQRTFGMNFEGFDRTVDSYIKNIRKKIEDDFKNPRYIKTIYSMGYKFM